MSEQVESTIKPEIQSIDLKSAELVQKLKELQKYVTNLMD